MVSSADAVIARVDAELARFLDGRHAALLALGGDLAPLAELARSTVLGGGKRLRPTFAYWGWRAAGDSTGSDSTGGDSTGSDDGSAGLFPAAAALELLHASALVHDDVMDASDTRRGKPAAHAALARLHRDCGWVGDADAFGASAAIVLGDLLLAWSDSMLAAAPVRSDRIPRVRQVFDGLRVQVMGGQYLDILVQARAEFSIAEALRVVEYKTSKYTVEGPLHLGAAIAGAPEPVFAALSAYGLAVGEAFQLRDDVLGVFGDPDLTGKPTGDDLREGKQTLLTALAVRAGDAAQADTLRSELGDRAMTSDGMQTLRSIIVDTGALDDVERRIADQAQAAVAALDTPVISGAARAALSALARSAADRTS